MDLHLKNKTALVTASTGGIGKQIALQMAAEGARVFINGRTNESVDKTIAEFKKAGFDVYPAAGDVGVKTGLEAIIEQIKLTNGVDVLVNNAGIYFNHDWFEASADDWAELYKTNVLSIVTLSKAVIPAMKSNKWGRIINIASGEATQPFAFMPDYAATKAVVANITVSLSKALSKTGITVNTVSPGIVVTDSLKTFYLDYAKKAGWGEDWPVIEKKIMETVLDNTVGRLGTPEDVAYMVSYLASPLSSNINGANHRVDGGSTIGSN